MYTFQQYFEEKQSVPPVLRVTIKDVGTFNAKADTGNDGYNVLHATDIVKAGDKVRFRCGKWTLTKPTFGSLEISKGPQLQEERHVIKLDVAFNGKWFRDQPFTISDRTGMDEPVLLSKDFLAHAGIVVDPSLTSASGQIL